MTHGNNYVRSTLKQKNTLMEQIILVLALWTAALLAFGLGFLGLVAYWKAVLLAIGLGFLGLVANINR